MSEKIPERSKITNPEGLPWRPELARAELCLRGQLRRGIFYQMYSWPAMRPCGNYVFETTDGGAELKLYVSAYTKPTSTSCWLPDTREYLSFDDFSITVAGQKVAWWTDWWALPPKASPTASSATPTTSTTSTTSETSTAVDQPAAKKRHLRLV